MAQNVKPVPDGYHTATPYLIVDGGASALEFYQRAFGAKEIMRVPAPGGKVGHAEIKIGNSFIMLADEAPDMDARSPKSYGGSPVSILLYVSPKGKPLAVPSITVVPARRQGCTCRPGTTT